MRRRKPAPWFQDPLARAKFERGLREAFPGLVGSATGRGRGAEVRYTLTVPVPEYEPRRIQLRFRNHYKPLLLGVTTDGPSGKDASPHRYGAARLCMWHPDAGDDRRWVPEDGLLALIRQAQLHLFREGWWRETGEWLGDEVLHGTAEDKVEQ